MNGPYNRFLYRRLTNAADIVAGTLRALLLRSTGTYVYNPDHNFVADVFSNGGVEISVASYARQTLGTKLITEDDANDRTTLDFADVAYGSLESGQTAAAIVVYEFITNDAASPLIYHIDGKVKVTVAAPSSGASASGTITGATQANPVVITSAGHGLLSGQEVYISGVGGMTQVNNKTFTVANPASNTFELSGINGTGYTAFTSGGTWNEVKTIYTDRLPGSIADGTSLTLGSTTGTIRANASKGDRLLKISSVSGSIALADSGEVQTVLNLPSALNGTPFTIRVNAAGFLALVAAR